MDNTEMKEKRTRKPNQDRSGHRYSEMDFFIMNRHNQFELAKKYLPMSDKEFDETQMFQFGRGHFERLCRQFGYEKRTTTSVVDTMKENGDSLVLFIPRGHRDEALQRKITISKNTQDMLDDLFKKDDGEVPRNVQSKIIEHLLREQVEKLLEHKGNGKLSIIFQDELDYIIGK